MSIVDIDKVSGNRSTPDLNSNDSSIVRRAHNTNGNTYRRAGGDVTPRMVFKNGLILTYDADNKCSSVYGYIPEISRIPILVIAKDGYDVFTDVLQITAPIV